MYMYLHLLCLLGTDIWQNGFQMKFTEYIVEVLKYWDFGAYFNSLIRKKPD